MDPAADPSSPGPRRATIEDVAVAAGVSVATVSRALRGLPHVAPATRQRVVQVATELAYRPDPAAARLATGRSQAVALAVPVLNSWYISQVESGAEAVCSADGYDLIIMGVTGEPARRSLLAEESSLHRRVDGVVFIDIAVDDDDVARLAERGLAVVTLGNVTATCPSVTIDEDEVARLATEHLLSLGHRRIGLLGGQRDDPLGFSVPRRRRAGHHATLERAGVEIDPDLEGIGNFSVMGGRDAMAGLLQLPDPPTAVFAMSDEMAFGAMLAARERGLDIPRDVSVVGVDDHDLSIVVGLTTVQQPVADIGSRAARLLLDQITGAAATPAHIRSPVSLVVRATTSAPLPRRQETAEKP